MAHRDVWVYKLPIYFQSGDTQLCKVIKLSIDLLNDFGTAKNVHGVHAELIDEASNPAWTWPLERVISDQQAIVNLGAHIISGGNKNIVVKMEVNQQSPHRKSLKYVKVTIESTVVANDGTSGECKEELSGFLHLEPGQLNPDTMNTPRLFDFRGSKSDKGKGTPPLFTLSEPGSTKMPPRMNRTSVEPAPGQGHVIAGAFDRLGKNISGTK